jgi:hypothetical protein
MKDYFNCLAGNRQYERALANRVPPSVSEITAEVIVPAATLT